MTEIPRCRDCFDYLYAISSHRIIYIKMIWDKKYQGWVCPECGWRKKS